MTAKAFVDLASNAAIPIVIAAIFVAASVKKINVYDTFIGGAKEGFAVAVRIIPYLVAMLVAIAMIRQSGVLGIVEDVAAPLLKLLGIPPETLPMALIRPLSGSGADAVLVDTMRAHGPDSLIGMTASTMAGSTETTFYILAVYFGAVGVTRIRHALWAGLCADVAGLSAAAWCTHWLLF